MAEIQAEADEKKRADEMQIAQIEAAKDQAKIQFEKELAQKECKELKAQDQASISATVHPPPAIETLSPRSYQSA